jgi:hypothetical protein
MAGLTGYLRPVGGGSWNHGDTWRLGATLSREVGTGAVGTCGAPGVALRWELGARVTGPRGAPGAALRREVGVGVVGTRGIPGAALLQEVDAGAVGTRGTPGAALRREVGAEAALSRAEGADASGTRGTPGSASSSEVGTRAARTRGALEAALRREVDAGAATTRDGPGATLSREVGVGFAGTRGGPELGAGYHSTASSARGQGVVVLVAPPDNPHWMIPRGKTGFKVVPDCPVLTAATSSPTPSPIPSSTRATLADPHWRAAMEDEYRALISNGTWELVPRPQGSNVVTGKWVFTHKLCADGTLDRYKARWVLRGFTQRPGVDYDETFSPVVKLATIRTMLATVVSRTWPIQQLDVKNVFLHGTLFETVFCCQPMGFADPAHLDLVCQLYKSLYGLKQALRAWYSRFATFLTTLGFLEAKSDTSLFIFRRSSDTVYLLLYVDDIILTASSTELLRRTIFALQREFAMEDLRPLHHFLGITVEHRPTGLFLHQRTYTLDILKRVVMADCKPCMTPVDLQAKLAGD